MELTKTLSCHLSDASAASPLSRLPPLCLVVPEIRSFWSLKIVEAQVSHLKRVFCPGQTWLSSVLRLAATLADAFEQ